MKLAIVPALALAAAGAAAMAASPASANPEVNRQATVKHPAATTQMPDTKRYGNDQHDDHNVCNIYQFFPGTNILSGNVLNDAVDAPIDVIVQVITLLTTADITSDKPIVNGNCI